MEIHYFAKWFSAKGRGIDPLSASEAASRHACGDPYIAELRNSDGTQFVVDIAYPWVSIAFFDAQGRIYLDYSFCKLGQDNLVLKGAKHWQFSGPTALVNSFHMFNFEPDGSFIASRTRDGKEIQVQGVSDPSPLFATFPVFGCYEELCVQERVAIGDA